MTQEGPPATVRYEVVLAGRLGPAYRAALCAAGQHAGTISEFLVPVTEAADVCELVAMLQARGMVVLEVRKVADPPSGAPSCVGASSPVGDASQQDATRRWQAVPQHT